MAKRKQQTLVAQTHPFSTAALHAPVSKWSSRSRTRADRTATRSSVASILRAATRP